MACPSAGLWVNLLVMLVHQWSCALGAGAGQAGLVVTVSSGRLQGVRMLGKGHARDYLAFSGIPYAQPPAGHLRFKAPQPPGSWDGIRAADAEGSVCPQQENGRYVGSEDCLFLNVVTPTVSCSSGSAGLAVLFVVHGGFFIKHSGSVKTYGPDFLVNSDVVLVTANYRVGALGFLNFNTEGIPGNAGLKDILAALRWVQQNIHAFCGDPARVTLIGQSAGSKAVSYLGISELSRGLFCASVEMSGNAMGMIAYTEDNEERCRELAARLGAKQDAASVEAALRTASAQDITRIAWDIYMAGAAWGGALPYNPYVPSRELRPLDSEPVFMTEDPDYLLSHPPVPRRPTLTGVVSREGLGTAADLFRSPESLRKIDEDLALYLQVEIARVGSNTAALRGVEPVPARDILDRIAQRVRDEYFQGNQVSPQYQQEMANLIGNVRYTSPLFHFASRLDRQPAPLYLYLFDVVTEYNLYSRKANSTITGDSHADDLAYLHHLEELGSTQDLLDQGLAAAGGQDAPAPRQQSHGLREKLPCYRSSPLLPPDASLRRAEAPEAPLPYLYIGELVETRTEDTLGAGQRLRFWEEVVESLRQRQPGGGAGAAQAGGGGAASRLCTAMALAVTLLNIKPSK